MAPSQQRYECTETRAVLGQMTIVDVFAHRIYALSLGLMMKEGIGSRCGETLGNYRVDPFALLYSSISGLDIPTGTEISHDLPRSLAQPPCRLVTHQRGEAKRKSNASSWNQ
ncbi:hypothetical protein CISG_03046 [Coccidioides immitis RMSCC 3703]|uniref:Uncharacterized protein n=1 Tax=Coccidioides immitis RMSCC 3703 TaxID=454286 RepID=A0A0J8QMF9_COCIT|nr:hypothetical protein CISG_03046 [Coccidioides immitis RMSCC 3703]